MSDERTRPTVDAATALGALEERQPMPLFFAIAMAGVPLYRIETSEPIAPAGLRAQAESLGFRYLGIFTFPGLFYGRTPHEVWLDSTGTVTLTLRRASAKTESRFEQMSAIFNLVTYFDDGSIVLTYGKKQGTPSMPRYERRDGTGFLDQDFRAHRDVVDERTSDRKALVFADLETHLRAEKFVDSRTPRTATPFLVARILKLGLAILVAFVLSRLI